MDDLRLVLIVIGLLAIGGLLLHGLWSSRREKPAKFNEKPLSKVSHRDTDGFDQDGIGEVRVVKRSARQEPNFGFAEEEEEIDPLFARREEPQDAPVPHFQANTDAVDVMSTGESQIQMRTEPQMSAFTDDVAVAVAVASPEAVRTSAQMQSTAQMHREPQQVAAEPAVAVEDAVLDNTVLENTMVEEAPAAPENIIIVLHVAAGRDQVFQGVRLVNSLERNGLQYGEMQLFHRYVTFAGSQEILFSAASMINPGIIDLDRLDKFETPGISFFMRVPSYGDGLQNFKLMLQCAQQIADELNGEVWDDERQLLTPQRIDGYRQKIKSVQ
ncbi:Cell division protein ZipA [Vibrio stylophorae]|uniref:Cell division protein ZipA n=1 Tax=Vibrio stylophorae TaxID=659351 RepID=A0ABM8ZV01_9VIBR|nr:cell division protein ZipA [Vibrio stylophorae]CAH0534158.1 Cell division protein ZipA [Vibrio stylophorae]